MNASGCRGGQRAVTEGDKFLAASVASARIFKNFLGFEIHETQTDGAASKNSFEMAFAAAAAEIFLGIEGDDGMPAFPDSFAGREAAEADAVADSPHAEQFVQFAARGSNSRGHHVGIVENMYRGPGEFAAQRRRQRGLQRESLGLLEIGRILDNTVSDDAGKPDANDFDLFTTCHFFNLLADAIDNAFGGHGLQRVEGLRFFRKHAERAKHLVGFHEANGDMFHHQHTNCLAHLAPANLKSSKSRTFDSLRGRIYARANLFKPLNAAAL